LIINKEVFKILLIIYKERHSKLNHKDFYLLILINKNNYIYIYIYFFFFKKKKKKKKKFQQITFFHSFFNTREILTYQKNIYDLFTFIYKYYILIYSFIH